MIRWITENLGTGRKNEVNDKEYSVVDVRDLVDREGNSDSAIMERIDVVVDLLSQNRKVVICCDYGMSRSNSIAIGAIVKYLNYNFDDAVKFVMEKTGEKAINLGVLNSVRNVLINKKGNVSNNNKKILITGGTGFIGGALVAKLEKNHDIVIPTQQDFNLLDGTINLDSMIKNNNVNTIIHLANPRIYTTTESMGRSIVMLKNVLDVCKENCINLLYLSGWVVYSGYNTSNLVASESLPVRPKGTYAETKVLCEKLINHYRDLYDLNIGLLRVSPVYGAGTDKPKFIYNFFQKALENETIFTHKYLNGFPELDLIHINDIVRAIECVVNAKPDNSFDLNIGSGIGYSTSDIAKMIKEICNSNSEIIHHEINDFVANIVMDTSKAKKVFGWEPTIDIKEGLKEIMNYIIEKSKDI